MKIPTERRSQQILGEYLQDLICEAVRPEDVDLLIRLVMSIQHDVQPAAGSGKTAIPDDRLRAGKWRDAASDPHE